MGAENVLDRSQRESEAQVSKYEGKRPVPQLRVLGENEPQCQRKSLSESWPQ